LLSQTATKQKAEPESINTEREGDIQFIEEKLNSMFEIELNREEWLHRGPDMIYEDEPEDLINRDDSRNRISTELAALHSDRQTSLHSFREDSVLHAEGVVSDRTDFQMLEGMLRDLLGEEQGFSSRRSLRNLRIRKELM
jgi:hypothetical protein